MIDSAVSPEALLKQYWGYDSFRPLQKSAVEALSSKRDLLVLMPTGGGKSLCFQIPALMASGTALVVSPLISLMKDQVDSLNANGIPAVRLDSSLSAEEFRDAMNALRSGEVKLLYLSPEKLLGESFRNLIPTLDISFAAVDEAHCVSMWGHDFRPEYRNLRTLRELFPEIPLAAFTATATQQVRDDIVLQLGLREPEILTGSFDRPNLTYRARSRNKVQKQIEEVVDRHSGESGILYCISRKETEKRAAQLQARGISAAAYHAGLPDEQRRRIQDDFIHDRTKVIAATVAFGMGIDKPDVRFVIHLGIPKSLENYQQETGRAGRDGLPSECILFFSAQDLILWKTIMGEPEPGSIQDRKLQAMYGYCTSPVCRHKFLLDYFQEENDLRDCGACDICLNELPFEEDSLVIAQKILSCVARLKQRFGGDYTAQVLTGSKQQRILQNGHESLSTWGLLKDQPKAQVRDWIEQLVTGGFLAKSGEYQLLQLTPSAWEVMRGNLLPRLLKTRKKEVAKTRRELDSWEGVDEELYLKLKALRSEIAFDQGLAAYMVFSDATLRDIARLKPRDRDEFLLVHGVGEKKWERYGEDFLYTLKGSINQD